MALEDYEPSIEINKDRVRQNFINIALGNGSVFDCLVIRNFIKTNIGSAIKIIISITNGKNVVVVMPEDEFFNATRNEMDNYITRLVQKGNE